MKNLRFMYILHSRLLLYAEMNFIVHVSPMFTIFGLISELVNIPILGNVSEFDNNLDYVNIVLEVKLTTNKI